MTVPSVSILRGVPLQASSGGDGVVGSGGDVGGAGDVVSGGEVAGVNNNLNKH